MNQQDMPSTFIQHPDLLFYMFCGALVIIGVLLKVAYNSFTSKIDSIKTDTQKTIEGYFEENEERFKGLENDVKEAKSKSNEIEKNYIKRFDEIKQKISDIQLANEKNSHAIKTDILEAISVVNKSISDLTITISEKYQQKDTCQFVQEKFEKVIQEIKNK